MSIAKRLVPVSAVALLLVTAHCGSTSEDELTDLGGATTAPAASATASGPTSSIGPQASSDAGRPPAPAFDAGTDAAHDGTLPTSPPPQPPDAAAPPQTVDPCASVTCGPNEVCVPYAHGAPLGACVPTCDCSNCGNCGGDNNDGRWNDQQEYCGNRAASPATMACNKPCEGAGIGCIPWGSTSICWPLEGCFSQ